MHSWQGTPLADSAPASGPASATAVGPEPEDPSSHTDVPHAAGGGLAWPPGAMSDVDLQRSTPLPIAHGQQQGHMYEATLAERGSGSSSGRAIELQYTRCRPGELISSSFMAMHAPTMSEPPANRVPSIRPALSMQMPPPLATADVPLESPSGAQVELFPMMLPTPPPLTSSPLAQHSPLSAFKSPEPPVSATDPATLLLQSPPKLESHAPPHALAPTLSPPRGPLQIHMDLARLPQHRSISTPIIPTQAELGWERQGRGRGQQSPYSMPDVHEDTHTDTHQRDASQQYQQHQRPQHAAPHAAAEMSLPARPPSQQEGSVLRVHSHVSARAAAAPSHGTRQVPSPAMFKREPSSSGVSASRTPIVFPSGAAPAFSFATAPPSARMPAHSPLALTSPPSFGSERSTSSHSGSSMHEGASSAPTIAKSLSTRQLRTAQLSKEERAKLKARKAAIAREARTRKKEYRMKLEQRLREHERLVQLLCNSGRDADEDPAQLAHYLDSELQRVARLQPLLSPHAQPARPRMDMPPDVTPAAAADGHRFTFSVPSSHKEQQSPLLRVSTPNSLRPAAPPMLHPPVPPHVVVDALPAVTMAAPTSSAAMTDTQARLTFNAHRVPSALDMPPMYSQSATPEPPRSHYSYATTPLSRQQLHLMSSQQQLHPYHRPGDERHHGRASPIEHDWQAGSPGTLHSQSPHSYGRASPYHVSPHRMSPHRHQQSPQMQQAQAGSAARQLTFPELPPAALQIHPAAAAAGHRQTHHAPSTPQHATAISYASSSQASSRMRSRAPTPMESTPSAPKRNRVEEGSEGIRSATPLMGPPEPYSLHTQRSRPTSVQLPDLGQLRMTTPSPSTGGDRMGAQSPFYHASPYHARQFQQPYYPSPLGHGHPSPFTYGGGLPAQHLHPGRDHSAPLLHFTNGPPVDRAGSWVAAGVASGFALSSPPPVLTSPPHMSALLAAASTTAVVHSPMGEIGAVAPFPHRQLQDAGDAYSSMESQARNADTDTAQQQQHRHAHVDQQQQYNSMQAQQAQQAQQQQQQQQQQQPPQPQQPQQHLEKLQHPHPHQAQYPSESGAHTPSSMV